MSENAKRDRRMSQRQKDKDNEKSATNNEIADVKKPKKRKDKSNKPEEPDNIPSPKGRKMKKSKDKDETTTSIEISDDEAETINKKKRESVKFTADTIDNEPEPDADESPKKRNKSDEETRLPTDEELIEIDKPENKKDVSSKRAQKRLKLEQLLAKNRIDHEAYSKQKALSYLSQWKDNRSEWKFEKLRQIWLQNHMFDCTVFPEKNFDTVVEYFGGSKGQIRETLIKDCTKIVDDEAGEEDEADGKYKRAKTLLQSLQE